MANTIIFPIVNAVMSLSISFFIIAYFTTEEDNKGFARVREGDRLTKIY